MTPWERVLRLAEGLKDEEFLVYGRKELAENYLNHYHRFGELYQPKQVLEFGVRFGYTGLMLMEGSGAKRYVGVDRNGVRLELAGMVMREWLEVDVKVELDAEDVRVWEGWKEESFDLVHCDAYHEDVRVELELGHKELRVGGVMVVDDAREKWVHDPVVEFFDRQGYEHCYVRSLTGQLIGVKK